MEPELKQQHTATTNIAKSASGFFDSNGSVAGRNNEHKERSEEDLAISVGHGLLKEILQSAPCPGPTPVPGSTVTVHFEGCSLFGEKFESSIDGGDPISFVLGSGEALRGWDEGIRTMKKGEVARFHISAEKSFGRLGYPPKVSPASPVIYKIELLDFTLPENHQHTEGYEKRITKAIENKAIGNKLFKEKDYKQAALQYNKAIYLLRERPSTMTQEEREQVTGTELNLYLNLAYCHLLLDQITRAIKTCKKALEMDKENAKAHYRLGQAYERIEEYALAKAHIVQACKLQPSDHLLRSALQRVSEKVKQKTGPSDFLGFI